MRPRCFELTRSLQLYPQLERTPDLSRGDQRLAAEVALATLRGREVPPFAFDRAIDTLNIMATG